MKVLFSAQDPGGRNAILPVVEMLKADGAEVGGDIKNPDIFIAGTSAGDSLDKKIMMTLGDIPSLYVLDFWLNYWQRFSTTDKKDFVYLPSKICIMDDIAKEEMIAEGFPAERLVITGNPHFDHFADNIMSENEDENRILFISQPLSSVASLPGFSQILYDEYATLKDVVSVLETLPKQYYLSLRLHPKEPADKYEEFLGPRVRRATEPTLEEALSGSGLIVGISSPVLMQAVAAGKRVLSYEPKIYGKDPLVSNRMGVTTRIESAGALSRAFSAYARDEWPFTTSPLRDVWPAGATERVVGVVHSLAHS